MTILPYLRAIMCGTACFTIRNEPRTLIGEHLVPEVDVDVLHLGVMQGREQGRIVDQDIDLAEALDGLGHQRLDLVFAG